MKKNIKIIVCFLTIMFVFSCNNTSKKESNIEIVKEKKSLNAKDILGNPKYLAISYGGYRHKDHSIEHTVEELKEDMKILSAM